MAILRHYYDPYARPAFRADVEAWAAKHVGDGFAANEILTHWDDEEFEKFEGLKSASQTIESVRCGYIAPMSSYYNSITCWEF